jgi:hypothetical protein
MVAPFSRQRRKSEGKAEHFQPSLLTAAAIQKILTAKHKRAGGT